VCRPRRLRDTHRCGRVDGEMGNSGKCSSFDATIGVDDETGSSGMVTFQVFVNILRYDSGIMTGAIASKRSQCRCRVRINFSRTSLMGEMGCTTSMPLGLTRALSAISPGIR
jgi:NPCBM/NEW2 domain-containing protein